MCIRDRYSIRGGIIDVYPPNQPHPCRVELFDIEVDSIRFFNPLTQRSIEEIDSVRIFPAQLIIQSDYLFEQAATRIKEAYEAFAKKLTGEKREKLASRQGHILESLETATNIQLLEHFIPVSYTHLVSEIMNIIGDIEGKNAILVDDIIDTAGTITNAANALKDMGAKDVYACATHAVLSGCLLYTSSAHLGFSTFP